MRALLVIGILTLSTNVFAKNIKSDDLNGRIYLQDQSGNKVSAILTLSVGKESIKSEFVGSINGEEQRCSGTSGTFRSDQILVIYLDCENKKQMALVLDFALSKEDLFNKGAFAHMNLAISLRQNSLSGWGQSVFHKNIVAKKLVQ